MMESLFLPLTAKKLQNIILAGTHLQLSKSCSQPLLKKLQNIAAKKIERYYKEMEFKVRLCLSPEQ
jgi:hypothetical protein